MHILFVNDFYAPFIGGTERQVQLLARLFAQRGYTTSVATTWHEELLEQQDDAGPTVYRLKGLTTSVPWFSNDQKRRLHPPFPDPITTWRLRRLVGKLRPDVVHSAGWISYSVAAALLGQKIPLIVSARDYCFFCPTHALLYHGRICSGPAPLKCLKCATDTYGTPRFIAATKALGATVGVNVCRHLLKRKASAIHCASTYMQRVMQEHLGGQTGSHAARSALTWAIIPSFRENTDQQHPSPGFVERLPATPYILFVGTFRNYKGLGVLLRAYQRLNSPPPLVLIGTVAGSAEAELPPVLPLGVSVLQDLPHSDVMAAWEHSLFGVAPSLWPEPFGSVIHEAMSKGKAVITSNTGGPPDMIIHGECGLLIQPGDVAALTQSMQYLIDNVEGRERLGQAARVRAELFTARAVIPRFEQLYRSVSGN